MSKFFDFVNGFNFKDAPISTQFLIKNSLLDIIGVIAAAKDNNTNVKLRNFVLEQYPKGDFGARILFDGRVISPLGAAWTGGFAADSLDAHEGHFLSKGHAGATVVPGLLSLIDAYKEGGKSVSGEEFLSLLTIAYETSLRAGVALMNSASDYHASGAFSGVGLVAAGARALNFKQDALFHALGIAEYFAPRCPMMRLVDHPTNLRDAHGAGAFSGMNALMMAKNGVTGAPADLIFAESSASAWRTLWTEWEIDNQYFKPWPVCRWAQPALTAVEAMLELDANIQEPNIESITIKTFHESMRLQGHQPSNADEAQYGLAFPVAAMICHGQLGPKQVSDEAVFDERVLALCSRIHIVESEELSNRFPAEILSIVEITLSDGAVIKSPISQAKGDPNTAMTKEDIIQKFVQYTSPVMTVDLQNALIEEVYSLEQRPDVSRLLDLITGN
ncbi:MmgE/PrpD family protein [Marinomonas atlantica]|uniref:MmgE/PrpD family protein n=1 Tax=Marinomonas atlantica TaxID=1806668 RepID=UPI0008362457|nr:MmgE/PrpD family protein [Marinomonas atlantica]